MILKNLGNNRIEISGHHSDIYQFWVQHARHFTVETPLSWEGCGATYIAYMVVRLYSPDDITFEKVSEGRYIVRLNRLRAGLVIGGGTTWGAELFGGKCVGYGKTRNSAARLLLDSIPEILNKTVSLETGKNIRVSVTKNAECVATASS